MSESSRENLDGLDGKSTESYEIIKKTRQDLNEHKKDVEDSLKTKEKTDSTVTGTFGGKIDYAGLKKEVNYTSYESLVKSMSLEKLTTFYQNIDRIQNANNLNPDGKGFSFTPFNIGELKDEFTKVGYEADGVFGGEEMASLIQLIENVYKTQLNLKQSKDFKDSLGIIFDYNQDGLLDDSVHFVTEERQIFDAIKTPKQFGNLLNNLGYSSLQEFNTAFQNNYFVARSEFKDRLATLLLSKDKLNPGEMINDPEAVKKFEGERLKALKVETEAERAVDEVFAENNGLKKLPDETKKLIKLKAVGVLVGSSFGVGVSFDIKEATNKLIDSLSFGIIDGVPGIGIAKEIFKTDNDRFKVNVGAVNFIPIISASGVLKEGDVGEFKKLFPNEIDKSTKVTLIGGLTPIGSSVMIDITKVSEKTKAGIELSKKKMSEILNKVFEEIKEGKSFDQSSFKEEPANKIIYERLASMYKSNGGHIDQLKEGALKNYETALYQNAEGFQFTGGGAGLLFVAGFLPIPLVLVHGEKHNTEWNEVDTYGSKENKKQKSKTLKTETTTSEKADYMKPGFEGKGDLNTRLESFEKAFSPNTRYNKGALKFMDPNNDLNTRWEGLEKLAKTVGKLKDANLKGFLNTVKTDNDKMVVVSTLSQYMKKANDFDGGDIKSWNTKLDKFIKNDNDRRKNFDGMFGFSLQDESDKYYTELKNGKGQIGEAKIQGIGFDAVSSKNVEGRTVKGIDTLYTNLSVLTVSGKPVLVPITEQSKIEAFKKTISGLKNISEQVKNDLITGINAGTIELNYYKDPQGFNDRILPIVKTKETTVTEVPSGEEAPYINVYNPIHSTINLVGAYVGDRHEDKEEEKTTESEKPTKPPTPTPTPTPGTGSGGSQGGGNGATPAPPTNTGLNEE